MIRNDYNVLYHKPSINGVVIKGSLTLSDIGADAVFQDLETYEKDWSETESFVNGYITNNNAIRQACNESNATIKSVKNTIESLDTTLIEAFKELEPIPIDELIAAMNEEV